MQFSTFAAAALSATLAHAAVVPRQSDACFLVGTEPLPQEVADVVAVLEGSNPTCSSTTTIGNVPDVIINGKTFSSISFAESSDSSLAFALDNFATADPLADTDLEEFQTDLDLYLATEAGIRSEGGNLAIKVPKFFLAFQVARIKTAQGIEITDAGQQVDHLLGKVTKNAASEDQALLDQVTALATQLS